MDQKLSFVIPCYRSEHTVEGVVAEIKRTVGDRTSFEIITVNDSSPDDVLSVLIRLAQEDPRVKVIDLARNMGKHAALMAGYSKATGDIIVNVDDDGQCPLDKLWELLAPLERDYDISMARYPLKKQSWFKNFGSGVNGLMAHVLIGKPKDLQFSNFSAMNRFVCDELLRYQNPYPYIDGLFLRTTNRIANVDMEERERVSGSTGYTFWKSLSLFLNGFTAFSVKPLRMASFLGFAIAILGFLLAFLTVVRKILNPAIAAGYSSLLAAILLIGGMIMVLLGMIGEYVGRIYISINNSPQYVIRKTFNIENSTEETGGSKG